MGAFARGEFDVLVSTTVVEVGVDVANARSCSWAPSASGCHSFISCGPRRRGPHQSYCVLLYQYPLTEQVGLA
jgi:RecG-like helicase